MINILNPNNVNFTWTYPQNFGILSTLVIYYKNKYLLVKIQSPKEFSIKKQDFAAPILCILEFNEIFKVQQQPTHWLKPKVHICCLF